ncbi:SpoIIE family protein phosphatase [Actinoplanes sp. NPDC020271]|uniref:SpoIIE family protein phosphatase n=1 Tax=Actinoplanes sp. NPDC020271 TaxID=3363896 RepID=UPI00379FE903
MDIPEAGDLDALVTAVDQLPFIVILFEGPELLTVGANAATRAVLPGREVIGRPCREVLGDLAGQQFLDVFHEVYRTGETVAGRQWRVHLDQPDGSVHEIFVTFTIMPWRRPDGSLRGVIGAAFEVTDMVRTRQAAEADAAQLRRRYEQTRDVITELQRELLPTGLPVLPGLQVAGSYLLADADTAAGGDWFDAVTRPDGRVTLVVGDVVGHGITASGVMGQLRAVLQERLDSGSAPADALAAVDRFATRVRAAHATTVCLADLDPANGELTYCTAGHPPPLVVHADGTTRFLPVTGAGPLGTGSAFAARHDRLEPGDLLLLYSDGILERPLAGSAADELARVAADAAAGRALHDPSSTPAERVCAQTIELLVRAGGHADDITLLAAQRVADVPEMVLDLPPDPAVLRGARVRLASWLHTAGAGDHDVFAIQHALGELATNAIEHSSTQDPISVRVVLTPSGRVEATVTDHGGWRTPERQPVRGRGLALTGQLVESLRVEPGANGTVATIRQPLSRPARLLASFDDAPVAPPDRPDMTIAELPGDHEARVAVSGPVDATTAQPMLLELLRRSRGGTVPMTVDLTGVTHLASAGVSALYQIGEQHHEQKAALMLIASPGSPARQILDLVGLPVTP